jgi:hypothetical protein
MMKYKYLYTSNIGDGRHSNMTLLELYRISRSVSEIFMKLWIVSTISGDVWKGVWDIVRPLRNTGKRNINNRWHPQWSRFRTRDPSVPALQHRTYSDMQKFLVISAVWKVLKVYERCNLWSSHDSFTSSKCVSVWGAFFCYYVSTQVFNLYTEERGTVKCNCFLMAGSSFSPILS